MPKKEVRVRFTAPAGKYCNTRRIFTGAKQTGDLGMCRFCQHHSMRGRTDLFSCFLFDNYVLTQAKDGSVKKCPACIYDTKDSRVIDADKHFQDLDDKLNDDDQVDIKSVGRMLKAGFRDVKSKAKNLIKQGVSPEAAYDTAVAEVAKTYK